MGASGAAMAVRGRKKISAVLAVHSCVNPRGFQAQPPRWSRTPLVLAEEE